MLIFCRFFLNAPHQVGVPFSQNYYHECVEFCHMLFCINRYNCVIFLQPIIGVDYIEWFSDTEPLHSAINPTCSYYIIVFIFHRVLFANILLKSFMSVFMRYIGLQYTFFIFLGFVSEQYQLHKMNWDMFPFLFSGREYVEIGVSSLNIWQNFPMKLSCPRISFLEGFELQNNLFNDYMAIQLICYISDELWQFVHFEELVHFI